MKFRKLRSEKRNRNFKTTNPKNLTSVGRTKQSLLVFKGTTFRQTTVKCRRFLQKRCSFENTSTDDSMDQDDSDSDTSVESQSFDEELRIIEEGDISPTEASEPRDIFSSIESDVITPCAQPSSASCSHDCAEQATVRSTVVGPNTIESPAENADKKLAQHFEEFMRSKRKVVDELVDQELSGKRSNEGSMGAGNSSIKTSDNFSKDLPDIVQNVTPETPEFENDPSGVRHVSTVLKREPSYESEAAQLGSEIEPCLGDTQQDFNEADCDLPWLDYLGLASGLTFLASCTNMSPFYYTLIWVAISLVSFRSCAKEKSVVTT